MPLQAIFPIPGFSEPFSSLSHLLSSGIFLMLGTWLIYRGRGSGAHLASNTLFTFAIVFLKKTKDLCP